MNHFSKMVVLLQNQISADDQITIIEYMKKYAKPAVVEADITSPFWIAEGLRTFNADKYNHLSTDQLGRLFYLLRLSEDVEWEWLEHPLTKRIQNILSPLSKALLKLNRVTIIVEVPGKNVPSHRDLIVGERYGNMISETETFWGDKNLRYHGDPWFSKLRLPLPSEGQHKKQNYYGLRIPISEKPGDNGKPFVQSSSGERWYYNVGQNFFLLDEATMEHGAEAVGFYRGVIIVDAQLDLNELVLLEEGLSISGLK
jgi:hypothetical protein